MAKDTVTKQKALTREVLVKELRASEKRIDTRFEIQTESLKDYIDSRVSQVETRLQNSINNLDTKINSLDKKLDVKVEGLVELIERRSGEMVDVERRLTVLEAK